MYIQSQADFFFCSHLITGSFQQKVSGSVLQTFTGSSPQSVGIWTYSQILKINGTGHNFKQKTFIQENFHAENIQPEDFQAGKLTIQKSKKQEN